MLALPFFTNRRVVNKPRQLTSSHLHALRISNIDDVLASDSVSWDVSGEVEVGLNFKILVHSDGSLDYFDSLLGFLTSVDKQHHGKNRSIQYAMDKPSSANPLRVSSISVRDDARLLRSRLLNARYPWLRDQSMQLITRLFRAGSSSFADIVEYQPISALSHHPVDCDGAFLSKSVTAANMLSSEHIHLLDKINLDLHASYTASISQKHQHGLDSEAGVDRKFCNDKKSSILSGEYLAQVDLVPNCPFLTKATRSYRKRQKIKIEKPKLKNARNNYEEKDDDCSVDDIISRYNLESDSDSSFDLEEFFKDQSASAPDKQRTTCLSSAINHTSHERPRSSKAWTHQECPRTLGLGSKEDLLCVRSRKRAKLVISLSVR